MSVTFSTSPGLYELEMRSFPISTPESVSNRVYTHPNTPVDPIDLSTRTLSISPSKRKITAIAEGIYPNKNTPEQENTGALQRYALSSSPVKTKLDSFLTAQHKAAEKALVETNNEEPSLSEWIMEDHKS